MKTTLLDRATHDIKMSKFILANASDELDYETSGYHLQQAIEKAMKFKTKPQQACSA